MPEKIIGQVTHYYGHLGVAVLKLSGTLCVGDEIHIVGHGADFTQVVGSLQVEHAEIKSAKAGDDVGLKVADKVRPGAKVYLVTA